MNKQMMKKYDREYQRKILMKLYSASPNSFDVDTLNKLINEVGEANFSANILYLGGHGLVECNVNYSLRAPPSIVTSSIKITHRGIDFVRGDGGLSAVLGVVTVKLHADTIRDIITSKIAASNMPKAEKKKFIGHVQSLTEKALEHLVFGIVDKGIDLGGPVVFEMIRKLCGF